jgi:hypothetical protein
MPVAPEETIRKLTEAITEAKATIRELHEARAAALDVMKQHRKVIHDEIQQGIAGVMGDLRDETVKHMQSAAKTIIARIEQDWREKLGLTE